MPVNYEELSPSRFVYMPKMGESATFTVKNIRKVPCQNPRFSFKQRQQVEVAGGMMATTDIDLGYNIQCDLGGDKEGKVLSISSISAFNQVFKKHNIQEGQTFSVDHPEKGVYNVTVS